MSDSRFAQNLNTHRDFLEELHSTHNKTKLRHYLSTASPPQLKLLVSIIHKTVRGKFPLKKSHFDKLTSARRVPYLQRTFQDKDDYVKLLKLDKLAILRKLFHILSIIPFILNAVLD